MGNSVEISLNIVQSKLYLGAAIAALFYTVPVNKVAQSPLTAVPDRGIVPPRPPWYKNA